jgi:Flp pilus assembly CpaE family ATPase
MHKTLSILVLSEDFSQMQAVRQSLAGIQESLQLQCVERASTAVARISGGGVQVVVFDLGLACGPQVEALERFQALHDKAPEIPVVVICSQADEKVAHAAVRLGAIDYVIRERCADLLAPLLLSAAKAVRGKLPRHQANEEGRSHGGGVISFLGVKGGVGTTSVAVNVAASLAVSRKVVLVELAPTVASLSHTFRPRSTIRTIVSLLETGGLDTGARLQACLWAHRQVPGLSILFGPQRFQDYVDIGPDDVKALLTALANMADFVVVDLPPTLSEANRAALQNSACVALVLERDPICLPLAKLMLQEMESWNMAAHIIGPVVVNRVPLSSPFTTDEIERELGLPPLGVIAPAPDLFLAAQRAQTPVVRFQPESVAGGTLAAVAARLAAEGHYSGRPGIGKGSVQNVV